MADPSRHPQVGGGDGSAEDPASPAAAQVEPTQHQQQPKESNSGDGTATTDVQSRRRLAKHAARQRRRSAPAPGERVAKVLLKARRSSKDDTSAVASEVGGGDEDGEEQGGSIIRRNSQASHAAMTRMLSSYDVGAPQLKEKTPRKSLSRKNSTPSMPPSRSTSVSSVAAAAAAPGTPDGKGSTAGESATYAVPLPPATAAVSANPGAADSAASGTARGYITFSAPSTSAAATEGINAPSRSKLPLGDILLKEWGWDKDDHATPGAAAPPLNPWQARLCGCGDDPPTYLSAVCCCAFPCINARVWNGIASNGERAHECDGWTCFLTTLLPCVGALRTRHAAVKQYGIREGPNSTRAAAVLCPCLSIAQTAVEASVRGHYTGVCGCLPSNAVAAEPKPTPTMGQTVAAARETAV